MTKWPTSDKWKSGEMGGGVRLKGVVYTGVHQDVNVQGDIKSTHVYMAWT